MNIVHKCNALTRKCKALAKAGKAEDWFFVAYAGVEVIGLHAALWWVSAGLLVTGIGARMWEWVGRVENDSGL